MRNELHPEFDLNDGTFWIAYRDFLEHFAGVNICKVRNWDEVRIKGKFVKVQDIEDQNIEVVMSKWYYSLEVQEKTRVIIGVHQEDERIKGVSEKRPYLDIGITIFKRTENSSIEVITMAHLK
jgi:calpain-15